MIEKGLCCWWAGVGGVQRCQGAFQSPSPPFPRSRRLRARLRPALLPVAALCTVSAAVSQAPLPAPRVVPEQQQKRRLARWHLAFPKPLQGHKPRLPPHFRFPPSLELLCACGPLRAAQQPAILPLLAHFPGSAEPAGAGAGVGSGGSNIHRRTHCRHHTLCDGCCIALSPGSPSATAACPARPLTPPPAPPAPPARRFCASPRLQPAAALSAATLKFRRRPSHPLVFP